jgi:endonuclease-8
MPEGPEIRRAADRIAKAVCGREAEQVRFGLPKLARFGRELSGRRVLGVTSRGKALLTTFEGGRVVYSHNQLYGRWYVCAPGKPPKTARSLRFAIQTPERWALLYSASDIAVLDEDELCDHPFLARIGPDLLDASTTPSRIARRLDQPAFRGRALGGLLLDQGFLAGVGNYLRSEILFFAGLLPEHRPRDLTDEERAALAAAAREVTRRSYRTGGVTELSDLANDAKTRGEPRRLYRHAVFARAGEACRRCGEVIEQETVAGRRLYLCPGCQA